jgi:hypothetical protein
MHAKVRYSQINISSSLQHTQPAASQILIKLQLIGNNSDTVAASSSRGPCNCQLLLPSLRLHSRQCSLCGMPSLGPSSTSCSAATSWRLVLLASMVWRLLLLLLAACCCTWMFSACATSRWWADGVAAAVQLLQCCF